MTNEQIGWTKEQLISGLISTQKFLGEMFEEKEKWRKRAEALERAINKNCKTCAYHMVAKNYYPCENCTISSDEWLFDEESFSKEIASDGAV